MGFVYDPAYSIPFISCLHAFDTQKHAKIVDILSQQIEEFPDWIQTPTQDMGAIDAMLATSHSAEYLDFLHSSSALSSTLEIDLLRWIPYWILKRTLVRSMKLQYAGSLLAADIALQRGWAINLGGGFHHASRSAGGGFCMYNDITAIVRRMLGSGNVQRVMIIDLDAHQGDGYEEDLRAEVCRGQVHIVDAYTPALYNDWNGTRKVIGTKLHYSTKDDGTRFLADLRKKLPAAIKDFQPDFVIYNAGTDPLKGDRYGDLQFTESAIIQRDELVWRACGFPDRPCGITAKKEVQRLRARATLPRLRPRKTPELQHIQQIPLVMLLSGGYSSRSSQLIAASFLNLFLQFGLLL
jgi:histone deacetylase 11